MAAVDTQTVSNSHRLHLHFILFLYRYQFFLIECRQSGRFLSWPNNWTNFPSKVGKCWKAITNRLMFDNLMLVISYWWFIYSLGQYHEDKSKYIHTHTQTTKLYFHFVCLSVCVSVVGWVWKQAPLCQLFVGGYICRIASGERKEEKKRKKNGKTIPVGWIK